MDQNYEEIDEHHGKTDKDHGEIDEQHGTTDENHGKSIRTMNPSRNQRQSQTPPSKSQASRQKKHHKRK